jgi:hypothetical protein
VELHQEKGARVHKGLMNIKRKAHNAEGYSARKNSRKKNDLNPIVRFGVKRALWQNNNHLAIK